MILATLAGRDASDHVGTVFNGLFGVEGALQGIIEIESYFEIVVDNTCEPVFR